MSAPGNPSQQSHARPSTPANPPATSQNGTPRSNPLALSQASPAARAHQRVPSGTHSPALRPQAAQTMQRTLPSNRVGPLAAVSGTSTPNGKTINGTNGQQTPVSKPAAGKTVPGMSSAGKGLAAKSLAVDGTGSRPVTPGALGSTKMSFGTPMIRGASPATSSQGGHAGFDALAGLQSPALAGMVPGMNDLGLHLGNLGPMSLGGTGLSGTRSSAGGRIDEDERRRRMEATLDTLRMRPGRISRNAIERLARRCELDVLPEGEDSVSLAGKNAIVIDLHYAPNKSNHVNDVTLQVSTASDELTEHTEKASKVLQSNLTPAEGTSSINAKLDQFADNLERLARMDKLSTPDTNCFEAVFGAYKSLKKLYDQEKDAAEKLLSSSSREGPKESPEAAVMRKQSGRPGMHARRRVGLSLDYWSPKYQSTDEVNPRKGDAMDVDQQTNNDLALTGMGTHFSVVIECEYAPLAIPEAAVKVTDSWISDRVFKPLDQHGETEEPHIFDLQNDQDTTATIEWQTPPSNGQQPQPDVQETDAPTTLPTAPHVRFVALFEPPLFLPTPAAEQLYLSVGLNLHADPLLEVPYDSLILPPPTLEPHPRYIQNAHAMPTSSLPDAQELTYDMRLTISQPERAVTLSRLPFSHPRQVVEMLPLLRQYALVSHILQNSFAAAPQSSNTISSANTAYASKQPFPPKPPTRAERHRAKRKAAQAFPDDPTVVSLSSLLPSSLASTNTALTTVGPTIPGQASGDDDLAAFLSAPAPATVPHTIDASFTLFPSPHLEIAFPTSKGLKWADIAFTLDGSIEVLDENILDQNDASSGHENKSSGDEGGDGEGDDTEKDIQRQAWSDKRGVVRMEKRRKLAQALEVCEDLGMWVLWVRRKVLGDVLEDDVGAEGKEGGDGGGMDVESS